MNADPPPSRRPTIDDLAAYVLDAVEGDEAAAIERHLAGDAEASAAERALRAAAGELGAAGTVAAEAATSPALRRRVLAAAHRRRPPRVTDGATAAEIHRVELSRALELLRRLGPDVWSRPVDPPEFAGWTVHDVVVHLAANESLLAAALGVGLAEVPEVETTNEPRTELARARHRGVDPTAAIAELDTAARAVDERLSAATESELDETVEFWGEPMPVRRVLLIRAFETWTHADDVRRVAGVAEQAPPTPSLRTMSYAGVTLVPTMLRACGIEPPARLVRFHLTGAGGSSWDVALAEGSTMPAGDEPADLELELDTVAFCRAVSNRVPAGGLVFTSRGDERLAAQIVDAVPALAVL